jgi:hypothetical protein
MSPRDLHEFEKMSRSNANPGAEGKRAFSLYGVNANDRVAACEHFEVANMRDAVERAQAQIDRFHKVELWEGCACVYAAARPKAAPRMRRSLISWTRARWRSPANS